MRVTSIRAARCDDLAQLLALLDRCSPETRYRRFHASTVEPMRAEMARVAAPEPGHLSWVALGVDGTVRGTATLAWPDGGSPEVAFLVEDAWFRRGIGRALVGEVATAAHRAGAEALVAWVQADNLRAIRFLRAVVPEARVVFDGGELAVTLPVARPSDVADPADPAGSAAPAAAGAGRAWEAA